VRRSGVTKIPGCGRHRALDPDSERDLIAWITQKAANNTAVNKTELLHQVTTRFGAHITRGWVDSFIEHHSEELYQTKSIPQENPRLEMPRVSLDAAIDSLRHHVHGSCAELVFNLGEVGIGEW
jgi:hypothetical protein